LATTRNNEALARQYLLGKLSEADARGIEDEYLTNDKAFEEMEVAEDEIIDAYARDELSREDREQFEKNLITSPRIRKRVDVAKLLALRASQHQVEPVLSVTPTPAVKTWSWKTIFWPSSPFGRFAFASLTLTLLIAVSALFIDWLRIRQESNRLYALRAQLEQENQKLKTENNESSSETQRLSEELKKQEAENSRLNDEIERALSRPSQPPTIPILLFISGARDTEGSNRDTKLPKEPAIFELTMRLEEAKFARYSVTVKTIDQRVISGPHEIRTRGKTLKLRLPSSRFKPNDYIATVSGVPPSGTPVEIEDYTFRIIKP
jgi:hypothetical protein